MYIVGSAVQFAGVYLYKCLCVGCVLMCILMFLPYVPVLVCACLCVYV